ncbi:MAG TPA: RDD family protein, partial [Pirellulales bacterium]
ENIAFDYQVAGPFVRLPAYLIDTLIRTAILICVGIAVSFTARLTGFGEGLLLIAYFLLDWFYGALFEALWNGQTPGKRAMQIRVVGVDGQPIAAWQAVLRNFLRFVDAQPMNFFALGLAAASTNRRFQRLGDWAARTMVVVEQPAKLYGVTPIAEFPVLALADRLPHKIPVDRSLARALSDYVLRRRRLHPLRRKEIAVHVGEPLRQMFNLPSPIDYDLLLCAVYHRLYFGGSDAREALAAASPLGPAQVAPAWLAPGAAFPAAAPSDVVWAPPDGTRERGGWR